MCIRRLRRNNRASALTINEQFTDGQLLRNGQNEMRSDDWICRRCGESVERGFEKCWNCGTDASGRSDAQFVTADQQQVTPPDDSWPVRLRGFWVLALLVGMLAAYLGYHRRSGVFVALAVICFGYLAVRITSYLLVSSVRRL